MNNETKNCEFCGEEILTVAIKCKHCGEFFEQNVTDKNVTKSQVYTETNSHPQKSGMAIASLVLGVLSLACLGIFAGIPAIILGHKAKSNILKSNGQLIGKDYATKGIIFGYIGFFGALLFIIFRFFIAGN